MASGLLALLDDLVMLAKAAAASLDDAASQTINASAKAAGVVIDDAARLSSPVARFAFSPWGAYSMFIARPFGSRSCNDQQTASLVS
jgi:hypothetical protein